MEARELHPVVAGLFARGRRRTVRVAIEQEYVVAAADGGVVPIEEVRRAAEGSFAAPYVSFEPGGQLELSLPPSLDPIGDLRWLTADLRRRLAGITLRAIPVDPRQEVPLQLTSARYVAMQRHFDRIGPAGRRMMRRTASTQICLDWWPGQAGIEQWQVLNLAGPFLAARFNHSERLATWLAVDPARTAFDDSLLRDEDPVTSYAAFAAAATVFVDGPVGHVSTLFPPVRPRGTYLEVRFLDALEPDAVERAVAVLKQLMYDDVRRRDLLRALEGSCSAQLWRAAAAGVLDQEVAA
ncbi:MULTISPECIES: glutamate-cysteine ligase family protein [Kribbella]|uniref:glutamate--cysteine ligase n=1 Tax=Kribbella pratensis TaxID=2512112 RepID=A0ABY2FS90_9ACTN|nr:MULTISPECIES: glutamate-cysteine ligase family protein [Kribbella]TDW95602.1 glutamate--cysteine ligase [Kribbella pratensis]TDW98953.1 glutamate--cysteine ligase [Kribbella sp. VKM Ac-2566]